MTSDGGRDPLEGVDPELLAWHQGALEGDPAVCCAPQPGEPSFPCMQNRAYHFEHRDVLGRTWPVREETLIVAAPRLTAGPDGRITLETRDHGPVTLTCPVWCHGHEPTVKHRADIAHASDDVHLSVPSPYAPVTLMTAYFEQRPFATLDPGKGVFLYLQLDGWAYPLRPAQVDDVAAALDTAVTDLRVLSRRLARYIDQDGVQ